MTVTFFTPGICAIWRATVTGIGTLSKRGHTQMRSARARSSIVCMVALSPIISPNRVKATVTDRKVTIERTGLRRNAAE